LAEVDARPIVTAALVAGLLAGYGIAMPVGPVGTYLVALTARSSLRVGACGALGVASADGFYATVAVLAGSAVAPFLVPIVDPLRWVSFVVLLALAALGAAKAIRSYRSHRLAGITQPTPPSPRAAYFSMLGMTLLSPMTVIYFTALVLGGSATPNPSPLERLTFAAAAFLASTTWQLLLATSGALLGRALTGHVGRLATALLSSLVITALAIRLVA
jgi:arginine exporter protein ArgO